MKIWIMGALLLESVFLSACKSGTNATNESETASYTNMGKTIAGVVLTSKDTGGSEFDVCAYEYPSNAFVSSDDSLEKMNFKSINTMKFSFAASDNQKNINATGGRAAVSALWVGGGFCFASFFIPPASPLVCGIALGGGVGTGVAVSVSNKIDTLDDAWDIALSSTPKPLPSADYTRVKTMLAKSGNTRRECSDLNGTELKALIEKGNRLIEERANKKNN
ncbi:MAG: hypothetical protein WCI18_13385 [Pseudomonadota bacterium]